MVYGAEVITLDQDNITVDGSSVLYIGGAQDFKQRYWAHNGSFTHEDRRTGGQIPPLVNIFGTFMISSLITTLTGR